MHPLVIDYYSFSTADDEWNNTLLQWLHQLEDKVPQFKCVRIKNPLTICSSDMKLDSKLDRSG